MCNPSFASVRQFLLYFLCYILVACIWGSFTIVHIVEGSSDSVFEWPVEGHYSAVGSTVLGKITEMGSLM